jgi:hypothetical protein
MVVRNLVATTCRAAAPEPDIDRSRPVPASPITKLAICRARMCRKHPDSTLSGESDIVDVPVVRKSTAHQILYAFDVSVRGVKQDDRLDASRKGIQMAGNARRHYLAGEAIVCRLRLDGATGLKFAVLHQRQPTPDQRYGTEYASFSRECLVDRLPFKIDSQCVQHLLQAGTHLGKRYAVEGSRCRGSNLVGAL